MNKRIKKKLNKRGFSLVELLAVIAIVGVISVLAIAGVTRYIDSAKNEKISQDKKSVSMAAQLYLQANRELYPKLIGDETRVNIADLKNKNYLKENITNDAGDSCMEKSFVRVYKLNEGEYSYTTYLYCGDEEPPSVVDVPKPVVTNFKFTGGSRNAAGNFNDVKDAKFSFTMRGSEDDDSIGIYSYSYAIYVKETNNADDAYTQVFDSESIKGGFEPVISVMSKNLSNYINLTGFSNIRVDVSVINEQGGKTDFSNIEGNFEDKQNPLCGTIEGQANDDNDWINKVSFGNKDVIASGSSRMYPARISVDCSDGFGSGCKRDRFTRSWPNDYDSVSGIDYNLGVRWSYITLEDNTNNKTNCYVRANVDLQAPKVVVTFYKLNDDGSRGEKVLEKTAQDQSIVNATMPSITINANEFAKVKGVTAEKWMNNAEYPNGVIMDAAITDNLYLYSYDWKTNNAYVGGGTGDAAIASTASTANAVSEQNGGTASSGIFNSEGMTDNPTTDEELKSAEHGAQSGNIKGLKITKEGKRYGVLTVCDKAGNCTSVKVYANLDRTPPKVPDATYFKGTEKTYSPADKNNYTDNQRWSNHTINAIIQRQQEDHEAPNTSGADLSGWNKFVYRLYVQDTTKRNKQVSTAKIADVTQVFAKGPGVNLPDEGIHRISFKSCDKAENCSAYAEDDYVKIDLTKPKCEIDVSYSPRKPNSAGWLKAGESATLKHICSDDNVYSSSCNVDHADNKESTTYKTDINTTKAGVAGDNKGGYVWDYAGNKSDECPKNVTVKIDTQIPSCKPVTTYTGTKKPNAAGWLKAGQSVKISLSCTDNAVNGVSSGCDDNNSKNKQFTEYKKDIYAAGGDPWAGAAGVGKGGTVMDIAGNESTECDKVEVRIDTKAPTCDTELIYHQGEPTSYGWLGLNGTGGAKQTVTVTQTCSENTVTGVTSSGCDNSSIKKHLYDTEIETTKAGAGGDGNGGGKIKDIAGNESAECPKNKIVKIDYTKPKCISRATLNSSTGNIYNQDWTNKNVVLTAQCTEQGSYKSGCLPDTYDIYSSDKNSNVVFTYAATLSDAGSPNARAKDKAGNYANCNKTFTVKIDKKAPLISCEVPTGPTKSHYNTDSDQKFYVSNSSDDDKSSGIYSGIKTTTYSLDGGSFGSASSKNLTCGSAQRTAIAKVTAVDYAGNSATGTCSGSVTVPSCCSSLQSGGQWYSSSCSKSCGGGTKNNYQLSALNGGQCNAYSSSCNTQSCCSSSNPYGCQWVTACREGQTWVYSDSGLSTYYAVVWHHTSGHQEDKMYILNHYGRGVYVYAPHMDKWGMSYTNYVYIYANCINQPAYYNAVCPYNSCPG